jgi:hypothetical protein
MMAARDFKGLCFILPFLFFLASFLLILRFVFASLRYLATLFLSFQLFPACCARLLGYF